MKAVVLLSGGLDSYTAAAMARHEGFDLYALTIHYGIWRFFMNVTKMVTAKKTAKAISLP